MLFSTVRFLRFDRESSLRSLDWLAKDWLAKDWLAKDWLAKDWFDNVSFSLSGIGLECSSS